MTTRCTVCMGALKIFQTLWLRLLLLSQNLHGLLFRSTMWMCIQNLKCVALAVPQIIEGCQKILGSPSIFLNPIGFLQWLFLYVHSFLDQETGLQAPPTLFLLLLFLGCCCYQICDLLRLFYFITGHRQTSRTHRWQHYQQSNHDGFST